MKNANQNQKSESYLSIPSELQKDAISRGNASIYKDEFSKDAKSKSIRRMIRGKLKKNLFDFLGKDRNESQRKDALNNALIDYRIYWRIQDFKIESFSNARELDELKFLLNAMQMHFKKEYQSKWNRIDAIIKKGK